MKRYQRLTQVLAVQYNLWWILSLLVLVGPLSVLFLPIHSCLSAQCLVPES